MHGAWTIRARAQDAAHWVGVGINIERVSCRTACEPAESCETLTKGGTLLPLGELGCGLRCGRCETGLRFTRFAFGSWLRVAFIQ